MEEAKEKIMEAVCDLCHYPYALTDQEDLDEICARCPVEKIVEAQLRAMSTATAKGVYTE